MTDAGWQVHHGDCLDVLRGMADNSVDAVVTDPPYGLSFMGRKWDYDVPSVAVWSEVLRVLKPGGHLLSFGGTRTYHRLVVAIEDAGFEIRDCIAWLYGSGFPKSLDVSKAIDKAAGAERKVIAVTGQRCGVFAHSGTGKPQNIEDYSATITAPATPATPAARQWQGWGTALKPSMEPICVARKPLDGTVAANVMRWGTGAINVDGCRVDSGGVTGSSASAGRGSGRPASGVPFVGGIISPAHPAGRWPANTIHDGSDEVVGMFPVTGPSSGRPRNNGEFKSVAKGRDLPHVSHGYEDAGGSAARFFYTAKASRADRDEGCEALRERAQAAAYGDLRPMEGNPRKVATGHIQRIRNHHPTVKPTTLMRYLCRLVTPPNGIVLDPFTGSGSTGKAATLEGFRFIGIELDPGYFEIAKQRIQRELADKASKLIA